MSRKERKFPPHVREKLEGLKKTIDAPFFEGLQQRWPVAPDLSRPVSQLCTSAQFDDPHYRRIAESLMKVTPRLNRKQWEFIYIIRSIEEAGLISPGSRGLVFGVGRERLPSVFVAGGCEITATDLPPEEGNHWVGGNQHADSIHRLVYPEIVSVEKLSACATFRPVNMNNIPDDLKGFDFCWSSCALEHLGSLEHGLEFIRNSIKCLKPGGIAVHTTEFNLGHASETLDKGPSVVYREKDLEEFVEELRRGGHSIELNLNPGDRLTDYMVDRDRDSDIHLRLYVAHKILATSIGLRIKKGV